MQYITQISKLVDKLKSLKVQQPQFTTKLQSAVYFECLKPSLNNKEEINHTINYYTYENPSYHLNELGLILHRFLQADATSYWTMKFNAQTNTYSCVELDLLQVFSLFKMPMDFPINIGNNKRILLSDIAAKFCDRANTFFANFKGEISPEVYTILLNELTHLNLGASEELTRASKQLIDTVCARAYKVSRYWPTNQLIHLVWSNAIHGLQSDGSFAYPLKWEQIKNILYGIHNNIQNGYKLDPVSAKELFQIYAAHYDKKDEFPKALYEYMQTFIADFKNASHGSKFEEEIQQRLSGPKGVLEKLASYEILNDVEIDVDNPIDPQIGLELDIRLKHKKIDLQMGIQIDGQEYHCFPYYFEENKTMNKRTQFRDANYKKIGCKVICISDAKAAKYDDILLQGIKNNLLIPAHLTLQQQRLNELNQASDVVAVKRLEVEELLTLALKEMEDAQLDSIKDTHLRLSQSMPKDCEIAEVDNARLQLRSSQKQCLASLNMVAQNSTELVSFRSSVKEKLDQISALDDLIAELDICIKQYTPFTQIQARINDLELQRNAIQEQIQTIHARTKINEGKRIKLQKEIANLDKGVVNGKKIGKRPEEIEKLEKDKLAKMGSIQILDDQDDEIRILYPQLEEINGALYKENLLLQKENPGKQIMAQALIQLKTIDQILTELTVFLENHPVVNIEEINTQLESIQVQITQMQNALIREKEIQKNRQFLVEEANHLIAFAKANNVEELSCLLWGLPEIIENIDSEQLVRISEILNEQKQNINRQIERATESLIDQLKSFSLCAKPALDIENLDLLEKRPTALFSELNVGVSSRIKPIQGILKAEMNSECFKKNSVF